MTWWLTAHWRQVRTILIVAATVLALVGLVGALVRDWQLSAFCWTAAFQCKWVECWLLERELVALQLQIDDGVVS